MARKASRFKVGLFVIVGLALGLAAMIYLGASRYAESGETYATFFNESVQGLSRDSVVKYLGVEVGRVSDIRVAPDNNLIEVVMEINFKGELGENMMAQLKMAGITGLSFIELNRRQPGEPDRSPQLSFAVEYPIIPSRPSDLQNIMSVVEKITKELEQVDFGGMADNLQGTLKSARDLLGSQELANTLVNLEKASMRLAEMSERLNGDLQRAEIPLILQETKDAVHEGKLMLTQGRKMMEAGNSMAQSGQSLMVGLQDQVDRMDLPGKADQAGRAIDRIDAGAGELMSKLIQTSRRLDEVAQNINRLVNRLERNPSDLIWGKPPSPRRVD